MSAKKEKNLKKPEQHAPDPQRSAKAKAAWTPERRAAFSAAQKLRANARGGKRQGGEEASVLGVLTFLRHAGMAIFDDIRKGEVTLRTVRRKDVLTLLAYVDLRDRGQDV